MTYATTISPLRQRMLEDMASRQLAKGTQIGHIRACKRFAAWLKRSPETTTVDEVRLFQLHLMETGTSIQTRNRTMTGLRFLFRVSMRRLDLANEIHHIKEPTRIPQILSAEEAARLLAMAGNLQVRVLLSIGYGSGLRVSEVVRLKVKHIDKSLDIIRVEQGMPQTLIETSLICTHGSIEGRIGRSRHAGRIYRRRTASSAHWRWRRSRTRLSSERPSRC